MLKFNIKSGQGKKLLEGVTDYTFFLLGAALYAFGFDFFIQPNHISPGGITGIASIINYLFKLPTGLLLFLLNIPILFIGFKKIGGRFLIKTLFVTAMTSVFIDLFAKILPRFYGDRFLAAIFGGLLSGLGLALVMLRGGTTGGIDVIAVILRQKFPYLSIGRLILILDSFIITLAAICYKEIETALFAAIAIFVSIKVIDALLYGADKGRLIFIVTADGDDVSKAIFDKIKRGVTVVPSYGGFALTENQTLLCAVRQTEVNRAISVIKNTDPNAFTVVTLTGGIFGRGFEQN